MPHLRRATAYCPVMPSTDALVAYESLYSSSKQTSRAAQPDHVSSSSSSSSSSSLPVYLYFVIQLTLNDKIIFHLNYPMNAMSELLVSQLLRICHSTVTGI